MAFDVRRLDEVDSTNAWLSRMVRAGEVRAGTAAVASHQSAGRGRRGRTWEAPAGSSLLVSVALAAPLYAPQLVTLAAALAARDACSELSGFQPALKWPNDLRARDRKLGGVLAEVVAPGIGVVGLGLNVAWGEVPLPPGAISLAELSETVPSPDALLNSYLTALERRTLPLDTDPVGGGAAGAGLLDDFRAACETIGQIVRVELPGVSFEGVATSVTDSGNLVVGDREVSAGDVIHLRRLHHS